MTLKPLGDRVIVTFEDVEEKTVGGLVLAGANHDATQKATVLAVGEGIRTLNGELVAPSVAVGNSVLVESGAGIEVKEGDQKVTIIREANILAIVE